MQKDNHHVALLGIYHPNPRAQMVKIPEKVLLFDLFVNDSENIIIREILEPREMEIVQYQP